MTETKVTRVGIYARVSTADKNQNPEAQLLDLRRYAKERGWQVQGEYVDWGVSGSVQSRPELNKLMDAARKRKIDVVLVWRFDRAFRNVRGLVDMLEELKALGIGFVSYQENIDTGSALGAALVCIIGAIGALEKQTLIERVHCGLRRARASGVRLGRPKASLDMKKVRLLRSQGHSLRDIAQQVNASFGTVARAVKSL